MKRIEIDDAASFCKGMRSETSVYPVFEVIPLIQRDRLFGRHSNNFRTEHLGRTGNPAEWNT